MTNSQAPQEVLIYRRNSSFGPNCNKLLNILKSLDSARFLLPDPMAGAAEYLIAGGSAGSDSRAFDKMTAMVALARRALEGKVGVMDMDRLTTLTEEHRKAEERLRQIEDRASKEGRNSQPHANSGKTFQQTLNDLNLNVARMKEVLRLAAQLQSYDAIDDELGAALALLTIHAELTDQMAEPPEPQEKT